MDILGVSVDSMHDIHGLSVHGLSVDIHRQSVDDALGNPRLIHADPWKIRGCLLIVQGFPKVSHQKSMDRDRCAPQPNSWGPANPTFRK